MRIVFLVLLFFTVLFSFSQELSAGFYQVDESGNGVLLEHSETDNELYLKPQVIIGFEEILRVRAGIVGADDTYALTFKLSQQGALTMKRFRKEQVPTKLALVLDNNIIHSVQLMMVVTGGQFSLNGFDKKEAKAMEKKLRRWKPNPIIDELLFSENDLLIYQTKAIYNGTELYNTKTDQQLFQERQKLTKTKCETKFTSYYNPLSLLGDFYSYEFFQSSEERCIKMGSAVAVQTIAIATGEPVSLLTLFKEEEVVAAFKADTWVKQGVVNHNLDIEEIKSFQDVLNFPGDKLGTNLQYSASSFCVVGFENGIATIRFVGRGYIGGNSYWHAPMTLELPVKEEFLSSFEDEQNFYLGTYVNGLTTY